MSAAAPWLRRAVYAFAGATVLASGVALWVDGHVPARVPADAPPYSLQDLGEALRAVDSRGRVDLNELKRRHAKLSTFLASLAATSPATTPDAFPTPEARLAYWLNAFHALSLLELLETRAAEASTSRQYFDAVPIGGRWLTRAAIYRRMLSQAGDARVYLAVFTGARGSGVLDGVPFDPDSVNPQLDDAARRFVRSQRNVSVDGARVSLSPVFERHRDDFLAALPDERKNVLQIVWAFLPDACVDDAPDCVTRAELDRACGNQLQRCEVTTAPLDASLAVKN